MNAENAKKHRRRFSSISLPTSILKEVDHVTKEVGYWPTKTAFVREACIEKLEKYKRAKVK